MRVVLTIWLLVLFLTGSVFGADRPPVVTSYRQMTQRLTADAAKSPLIRLVSLGQSARGKKNIWLARIADPAAATDKTVRIFILCRQHGDEPASTEAALRLLSGVADGQDAALVKNLQQVTLYVIPMVNPDGADAMTRRNGVGADLNRDWGIFSQPETQAVARAARLIRPQIIIDAHNWDGDDPYNANCIEAARLETTPLVRAQHDIQQAAAQGLARSGYQVFQTGYGPDSDPHLAHRYFMQQGVLSVLVETHSGDPLDTGDFQRRQGFYLALIHGLADRYGQDGVDEGRTLERLETGWTRASLEADLFPAQSASRTAVVPPVSHPRPVWLWMICLYGVVLWVGAVCRRTGASPERGNGKARKPVFVPASERPSAGRPGKPRYRYSPCSPGFRPVPVACARKR